MACLWLHVPPGAVCCSLTCDPMLHAVTSSCCHLLSCTLSVVSKAHSQVQFWLHARNVTQHCSALTTPCEVMPSRPHRSVTAAPAVAAGSVTCHIISQRFSDMIMQPNIFCRFHRDQHHKPALIPMRRVSISCPGLLFLPLSALKCMYHALHVVILWLNLPPV